MRTLLAVAASAVFAMLSAAALADDKSDCQNNGNRDLQIKGLLGAHRARCKGRDGLPQPWRRLSVQGRPRSRHRRLQQGHRAQTELRPRLRKPRQSLCQQRRLHQCRRRRDQGHRAAARKKGPPAPKAAAAKPPNAKVAAKPARLRRQAREASRSKLPTTRGRPRSPRAISRADSALTCSLSRWHFAYSEIPDADDRAARTGSRADALGRQDNEAMIPATRLGRVAHRRSS